MDLFCKEPIYSKALLYLLSDEILVNFPLEGCESVKLSKPTRYDISTWDRSVKPVLT